MYIYIYIHLAYVQKCRRVISTHIFYQERKNEREGEQKKAFHSYH